MSIHAERQRQAPGLGALLQCRDAGGMCRAAGGSTVIIENGVSQLPGKVAFRKS